MRIKKAKVTKENKVLLVYEQRSKTGGWDEYSLTCSEEAKPSFYRAMDDLKVDVIEMCELPESYLERIKVRGVSFSYGGECDVMGATISAAMELKDSYPNLNINTPHKASQMYSEAPPDEMQLLSSDCIGRLDDLKTECQAYIKGERAQTKLFEVAS